MTVETDHKALADEAGARPGAPLTMVPSGGKNKRPIRIEPDLDFIRVLGKRAGDTFIRCFQCGTCSATCAISPDVEPFPRKEMSWASWGLKDLLLKDPDVWLCYQCHDCSTRCPRGARPGDVLAAVRQECIQDYSFPRFLARWVGQPQYIPLLLGIPALLLYLALIFKTPIENALGLAPEIGPRISFAYSSVFPHWLLNSFFFFFTGLMFLAAVVGIIRFWRAMKTSVAATVATAAPRSLPSSLVTVFRSIITHDKFSLCTAMSSRLWSHVSILFGFLALAVVTFWVITSGLNPVIRGDFVYPFSFWSPWKMLANIGGVAVLGGCLLMIYDRFRDRDRFSSGNYFDWSLLAALLLVILTGFITEILHYVRLEPHRHIAYFVHLVFVCGLLFYLPYSKLAHLIYRTTALVFAEYTGRGGPAGEMPETTGTAVSREPTAADGVAVEEASS